jgi:hypothetical protein
MFQQGEEQANTLQRVGRESTGQQEELPDPLAASYIGRILYPPRLIFIDWSINNSNS